MAFLCYVAINTVQNSLPHRTQYLGDPTLVFPDHGDVHLAPESGIISYYLWGERRNFLYLEWKSSNFWDYPDKQLTFKLWIKWQGVLIWK